MPVEIMMITVIELKLKLFKADVEVVGHETRKQNELWLDVSV